MHNITCSIVIYKTARNTLLDAISSFLNTELKVRLYLIDNSPANDLRDVVADDRVVYIHNPSNPGYGSAHNIGISRALEDGSLYHLVMNPDIKFGAGTLEAIFDYMNRNEQVGSLMPKILSQDGTVQRLCKLLPTPMNLIGRRFISWSAWAARADKKYELHEFDYNSILNVPCLSGCFMFLRLSALKEAGFFDPRYFMYLEDYDLNRRIHRISETIFYPHASVIHGHAKESYRNEDLLKIHIRSAISYFNKWGWIFDKERRKFNRSVLKILADTGR